MEQLPGAMRGSALTVALAALLAGAGCHASGDGVQMHAMKTKESLQAARDFLPRVESFLATLPVNREKFSVRVNRCDGPEGEQRDDIYYIWIGLQAVARGNDAARVINEVHARWQEAGWEVTRHRELANGGVNLAATEPGSGDAYALDSGFDKGPDSYVVGFFNTPCFQSPSGDVQYGEIRHGLEGASAAP